MRYYRNAFIDNTALADDEDLPIQVTRTDAEKMAYACIADMGYNDMQMSSISRGEALTGEEQLGSDGSRQAYVFFFTREIDGIPLTYEKRERAATGGWSRG